MKTEVIGACVSLDAVSCVFGEREVGGEGEVGMKGEGGVKSLSLCMYVCVCACLCEGAHVCVSMCACGGQRMNLTVIPQAASTPLFTPSSFSSSFCDSLSLMSRDH